MGQGGYLTIYNATQYTLHRLDQGSYQMNAWDLPVDIAPFTAAKVYVEFNEGIGKTKTDDSGSSTYSVQGVPAGQDQFVFRVTYTEIKVDFTTLPIAGAKQVSLGWAHDGVVSVVLAGTQGNFHAIRYIN